MYITINGRPRDGAAAMSEAAACRPTRLRSRRLLILVLALSLAVVGMLAFSHVALADSATLSVTNTAGEPDPAAELARVFTLSGKAAVPEYAFVKYRATGGAACAPDAREDTGDQLEGFYAEKVEGDFSIKKAMTWGSPGSVQFCIWLAAGEYAGDAENTIVTPITQIITFRAPGGTIGGTLSPSNPQPGQTATLTVTGSSEAPQRVYATVRAAGGACAPTYESEDGDGILDASVNGGFSVPATFNESQAGQYLICMWLAGSGEEAPAIAGPQPIEFTVGSATRPTKVCVVPAVTAGTSLARVKRQLRAAHCKVGKRSRAASRAVRRGTVLKLDATAGTSLPVGSAVGVTLSAGPPCVVPALPANISLGAMEHRIVAAHCSVGEVGFAASADRHRGTVIRLKPGPGKTRPPRAKVKIVVSYGPPRRRRGGRRTRSLAPLSSALPVRTL